MTSTKTRMVPITPIVDFAIENNPQYSGSTKNSKSVWHAELCSQYENMKSRMEYLLQHAPNAMRPVLLRKPDNESAIMLLRKLQRMYLQYPYLLQRVPHCQWCGKAYNDVKNLFQFHQHSKRRNFDHARCEKEYERMMALRNDEIHVNHVERKLSFVMQNIYNSKNTVSNL